MLVIIPTFQVVIPVRLQDVSLSEGRLLCAFLYFHGGACKHGCMFETVQFVFAHICSHNNHDKKYTHFGVRVLADELCAY